MSALGSLVNEITGVAPWQPSGSASAAASCDGNHVVPESPYVVISVDSLRPRAPARATRGGQALSSQSSALSSQASQHRPPTQLRGEGHDEDARDEGEIAAPACLLVRIDMGTGTVNLVRHLSLFDIPAGCGGESSRDKSSRDANVCSSVVQSSESTAQDFNLEVCCARCSSVACDARHVAAGFPSGTIAIWSASSARLVALLRDPRRGGEAGGGSRSRGRPSASSQHAGGITCVAIHPTRRIVVAGRSDGVLDIWAAFSGEGQAD